MPADYTQDYLVDNEREQYQQDVWLKTPGGGGNPELIYVAVERGNEIDADLEIQGILGGATSITSVPDTAVNHRAADPSGYTTDNGLAIGQLTTSAVFPTSTDYVWISTRATDSESAEHFGLNVSLPQRAFVVVRESFLIRNDAVSDPEEPDYLVPIYIVPQTIV